MISNKLVNSHYGPMLINSNDQFIGASIERFGSWAADDIELIKSILQIQLDQKTHVSLYDVGANIGTHTVALARHFGPSVSIRAFEAQRHMYYLLCGNVALNGLDNVICEHVAVSDGVVDHIQVTMPDYNDSNNFGGFELINPVYSDNQTMTKDQIESVRCTTIDHYNDTVDFIKLDIEGMELLALAGAEKTIKRSRPICFVEVLKSDKLAIQSFFQSKQFVAYQYKDHDWIFVPEESDVELDLPILLL